MIKSTKKSDSAIHPGETLMDILEEIGLSQKDFALRADVTEKHISRIVNGKVSITPEMAIKLCRIVGPSASFWNNLDKNYRELIAHLESQKGLFSEKIYLKEFSCYNELVKHGFVNKATNWQEKVENLLSFFRVDSLSLASKAQKVDFRQSTKKNINKNSVAAWLRCGEIKSEEIVVSSFNKNLLIETIPEFRKLTYCPEKFSKKMQELCARCGILLVFVPYLKNTYINGAFRWFNGKPLIQMTILGKDNDIFWFSFFHELGHLILHGKKDCFLEFDNGKSVSENEKEADIFAANNLISPNEYEIFIKNDGYTSIQNIRKFAKKIDVSEDIVMGRLAHEEHIPWSHIAQYRRKLRFS